jgi:putative ABC transport system permease protein
MKHLMNTLFLQRLSKITLKNLNVFRTRVILTVCGILFGIISVIGTFTVNGNLGTMVGDELKKAGVNTLTVSGGFGRNNGLSVKHANAIRKYCPAVMRVIEMSAGDYLVANFRGMSAATEVSGVGAGFFEVRNMKISAGRTIQEWDRTRKVAVIGSNVAQQVFGNLNPIGRVMQIRTGQVGIPFRVVGVLPPQGNSKFITSNGSPDDTIFVPILSLQSYLVAKKPVSLLIQAFSERDVLLAKDQITKLLERQLGKNLRIKDPREEVESNRKIVDGIVYSGMVIGILSLISGGIGIMNIMLVSVMQRRREIGLYKAIGFNDQTILLQFIAEALAISLLGCVLGLGFGIPGGSLLSSILLEGFSQVNVTAIMIAIGFSLTVGVLFGYLPASKAAELDPVDALKG